VNDQTWLVVGLGNPGPEYAKTRHNIGAMAIESWAARLGWRLSRNKKAQAFTAEGRVGSDKVVLALPQTYMNQSGSPVKALMDYYKIDPLHVIVLHDELDIPFETLRLKLGGGDNGHNGLRSIRSSTGTGDWYRVRLGIGRPPGQQDPSAFVLKAFSSAEAKLLDVFCDRAADAVESLMGSGLEIAQSRYNQ